MANSTVITDLSDMIPDEFYALFNGADNIIGKDIKKLKETKTKLEFEKKSNGLNEQQELNLTNINSQLGLDKNGNKKNPTCWKYVKKGYCKHLPKTNIIRKDGCNIHSLWHPGNEEIEYLKKKNK